MFSPNMVVDGFTWKEVTGPGTTLRKYNMDTIIVLMHIICFQISYIHMLLLLL